MKHTFLNQRKIFQSSNIWRWLLFRCMGFLLLIISVSTSLPAQKVLTGSGSVACDISHGLGIHRMGSLFYDNDPVTGRIEYVACPQDSNRQLVKVAISMFDVAPGDTLTIYEGCGITNTIVAQTHAGGASAATALPSSWFQADCDSGDGCLTFVFAPDGDPAHNKGKGIDLDISCTDRPSVITCPVDINVPSSCDINNSNKIGSLYTIQGPTATCSYEPNLSNVTVEDVDGNPITTTLIASSTLLTNEGEYHDADGSGNTGPTVGDEIFLEMKNYKFSVDHSILPTGSGSCMYTVSVAEIAPVCNNQINISLSTTTCSAQLNADMLIEGDGCSAGYMVNIIDGVDAGTDIVTYANVGHTIKVSVATPSNNKCWGLVLVEDKAPPIFTCPDTAIYCGLSLNPDISNLFPKDGKDCTSFTYEYVDGPVTSYGCNDAKRGPDADTIGIVQRVWTAIDAGGARSDTCIQNIYRLRPHLTTTNIVWPADIVFYCEDDPDRNFPPTIAGFPQVNIDGQLINLETTCLFGIDFDDTDFTTDCEGVVKKSRIWTIMDWCGNGSGLSVLQSEPQIIKMTDTIPPVLVGEPNTLEHFSSHGACSAHVIFPAITVTDACTPSTSYKVQGPLATISHMVGSTAPDTMWNVPFGTHDFVYIGEDDCGNQVRHMINMEIKDLIHPVAIVSDRSNVSLTNDEDQTWVYATSFDNGSHDNCGVTDVLARRMPEDTSSTLPFTESVGFTCADLGDTIMVQVRVLDACGNIGENMTEVIIVDKNGVCDCGMTTGITVDGLTSGVLCGGDIATLTASGGANYVWAAPINSTTATVTVNPTTTTTYTVTISNNFGCEVVEQVTVMGTPLLSASIPTTVCNNSTPSLTVTATGGTAPYTYLWSDGTTSATLNPMPTTDTQYTVTVTDVNGCPTTATSVMVPAVPVDIQVDGLNPSGNVCLGESITLAAFDNTINTQSNYSYLWESGSPTYSIMPTVEVTTTYIVTVTDIATTCIAVDSVTINTDTLPMALIKVDGTETDIAIFCEGEMLDLVACGGTEENEDYAWESDFGSSAIIKTLTIENGGTYTVTVTDGNGCTGTTSIVTTRSDISATIQGDTIVCPGEGVQLLPDPVTELTYTWTADTNRTTFISMDTTVTPEISTKYYVTITDGFCEIVDSVVVQFFILNEIEIEIIPNDNTVQPGDMSTLTWTNSTANSTLVWIPDSGNPSFGNLSCTNCNTTVFTAPNTFGFYKFSANVTDANGCSVLESRVIEVSATGTRPAPMATLSGTISTEEGEMVERATITLTDYDMPAQVTGATGDYGFQELPINENYTVLPEKDVNPLNGVSTYDLVLISKHILGITPLDSPYKMIAADVNHSGTITAFDMVQLRQLILNIKPDFTNNTSWRFVDAAYEFSDPTNPFREAIPETYTITDLTGDMTWLDFIAVKVGDVNNSAVVNNFMTTESRSTKKSLDFQAKQGLSKDGQYIIFDFTASNFNAISGYQFALEFDPAMIVFDQIVPSQWVGKDNFGLSDITRGQLATSWNQAEGLDVDPEEILFSLVFQINGEITSDELLKIANTDLQAEAYDATGELLNVQLLGEEIAPQVAAKSIQLFQNKPNPFTGKTTIGFALPEASEATLRIFDSAGKMIQVYDGYYEKGYSELIISSQDLTQYGALYYQLATPTQVATMKMIHAQ